MLYQHIGDLVDKGLTIGAGLFLLYLSYYRPKIWWKNATPEVAKKRLAILRFCAIMMIAIQIVLLGFFDWNSFHAEIVVRHLGQQAIAISQAAEKMPPGDERQTDLIRQLQGIDSSSAPPEVKEALNNFISALEQELQASKNHQDTAPFIQVCHEDGQVLTAAIKKYI